MPDAALRRRVLLREPLHRSLRSLHVPGLEGVCSPVSGPQVGTRPACPGSGPCQGICDGQNRTQCVTPVGAECGAPTCSGGFVTTYTCAANGTCTPSTTSCAPFGCRPDGTACATSCQSHDECGPGNACVDGACVPTKPLGQSCAVGEECQSGICARDICCAAACEGACRACNVAGNEGLCTELADGEGCADGTCCDGDCVEIATDLQHCGACDQSCPPPTANATAVCANSTCGFVCNPDFTECGGAVCCDDATQGCDEQTDACCTTSTNACGSAGDAPCCEGLPCVLGICDSRPVAADQSGLTVDRDRTLTITLTGSDADGDPLIFAIVTGPTKGTLGTITQLTDTSATVVYTPGPNDDDVGADSLTFTVNTGRTATGIVNLTGAVWYIDNRAPIGGSGRSTDPFPLLSMAGTNVGRGQTFFVFAGDSATTPYGAVTLRPGQVLLGEGVGLTVAPFGELVPAGERPVVSAASGAIVELGIDNTVRGLDLKGTGADSIALSGLNFGTATIDTLSIDGAGAAIELTNGTLAVTLDSLTSTDSNNRSIHLENVGGTFIVTGGSIAGANGP